MGLAMRLRERFPDLMDGPYAPRRHPIISTQVTAQQTNGVGGGGRGRPRLRARDEGGDGGKTAGEGGGMRQAAKGRHPIITTQVS